MANFMKQIIVLLTLLVIIGLANCARQKSPLLVEDDGSRRNRPAGKSQDLFLPKLSITSNQVTFAWSIKIVAHSRNLQNLFIFSYLILPYESRCAKNRCAAFPWENVSFFF